MPAIGVFGGSFDPVHKGHVAIARAATEELSLLSVRWVPTGIPGHRSAPLASPDDRVAMLRLALAGDDRQEIDCEELDLAQQGVPTYTVNTLTRLRMQVGNKLPIALIIGSDQFSALDTWHDWLRLFELAHIAVAERPGHVVDPSGLPPAVAEQWRHRASPTITGEACGRIVRFAMPAVDASSTAIRRQIAGGLDTSHLLPGDVLAYIRSHGLYSRS